VNRSVSGVRVALGKSAHPLKAVDASDVGVPPVRVLVCEDDPVMLSALCDLIGSVPSLQLVGYAGDAHLAAARAVETAPDVVVIDVRIPGGGARAARAIGQHLPDTRLIAFSAHADRDAVLGMVRAGVDEYLVKGIDDEELVDAIGRHGRGRIRLPAAALQEMVFDLAHLLAEAEAQLAAVNHRQDAPAAMDPVLAP
jgi:DNA-binding NarL/FixJ family response regulator